VDLNRALVLLGSGQDTLSMLNPLTWRKKPKAVTIFKDANIWTASEVRTGLIITGNLFGVFQEL
jgi:hypothetical protein